ncbi:hypothetical protein L0244_27880, partial [bacterium]|nr:hypothetical protein [bacterium]
HTLASFSNSITAQVPWNIGNKLKPSDFCTNSANLATFYRSLSRLIFASPRSTMAFAKSDDRNLI